MKWAPLVLTAVVLLTGCVALPTRVSPPPPSLDVPYATRAPVIDGRVSETEWSGAAQIDGLKPCRDGTYLDAITRVPTVVRLQWDTNCLYVAFVCVDDDIFCSGEMGRDDNLYKEDVIEVFLDAGGDGQHYTELQVSPRGETLDLAFVLTAPPESTPALRLTPGFCHRHLWTFRSWDFEELRVAARTHGPGEPRGWTAEMAIPATAFAKRLGSSNFSPGLLRANLLRYDWQPDGHTGKRKLVHMNWAPVQHGCPHISPQAMGTLRLMAPR